MPRLHEEELDLIESGEVCGRIHEETEEEQIAGFSEEDQAEEDEMDVAMRITNRILQIQGKS